MIFTSILLIIILIDCIYYLDNYYLSGHKDTVIKSIIFNRAGDLIEHAIFNRGDMMRVVLATGFVVHGESYRDIVQEMMLINKNRFKSDIEYMKYINKNLVNDNININNYKEFIKSLEKKGYVKILN